MASSLGRRLRKRAEKIERRASEGVRRAAGAAAREAISRTPVLTGRARSNWQGSVGAPKFTDDDPPTEGSEGAATEKAMRQTIQAFRGWQIGDPQIYLANGVPHAPLLDAGTASSKAPEGMTRFAVEAARAVLRQYRLLDDDNLPRFEF